MSIKEEIALLMAQYYDESVDNTNVVPSEHDLFLAEMLTLAFDIKRRPAFSDLQVDTTEQDADVAAIVQDFELDKLIENLRAAARGDRVFLGYGQFD